MMRITFSQLLISLILSAVTYAKSSHAQIFDKVVSVNIQEPNLDRALKVIEQSANVKFVYSKSIIKTDTKINYQATNQRLDVVLNNILPQQIAYQLINDRIVLSNKRPVTEKTETAAPEALKQAIPINGKIVSDKGEELVGVSVTIKGTTTGTLTDAQGNFTLNVPDASAILIVKYVGFTTQEIAVGSQTTINIKLITQPSNLSEVVVVGYNVVRRSDVTSSVVSVNAEEIRSRPVANALQAIQGKAAGVDITSNERPGEIGQVRIRGVRSLTANNNPLYVVDGIPLDLRTAGIETINPNDIESIDILKDASATAVYGSRGANGVILVTTKRGKNGRMAMDYVGTVTVETLNDRINMMDAPQYIEFRRDAYRRIGYLYPLTRKPTDPLTVNPNSTYPLIPTLADDRRIFGNDPYAQENIARAWQSGTYDPSLLQTTNWTDMVKKTGVTQDHVLSVSGGTDKIKAYTSFGFLHQDGTQLGQDYTRYSTKVSVDVTPTKWFSMGGSINASYAKQNFGFITANATGPNNLYFAAQGQLPYAVPFDANGNRINLPGGDVNIQNPIGEDKYNINLRKIARGLGSFYAEITPFKGLKYRIQFGPDFYNANNGQYADRRSINQGAGQAGAVDQAQLLQNTRLAWTLDHLIYYNKSLGKHDFGVTLLQSSNSFREESSNMVAQNLPFPSQLWYQLNSVPNLFRYGSNLTDTRLNSYMARVNYTFNNKYVLTAFGRWDGATQLSEGNKWDFFPSASLAWRIDQEDFIKQYNWIDQLKLRAGVGSVGNAAIDPYLTLGNLQPLYYTYGTSVQPGYVSSDPSLANPIPFPNKFLGWERTTQYNFGLDYGFLDNRISGSIDVYFSRTSDLLLRKRIPSINGYAESYDNVGKTSNRGFEINLSTVNIKNKNFTWNTTLNFSASRDKITELSLGKINDVANLWFIGERLSTYYDFEKVGIWQDNLEDQAEMKKFTDANGGVRQFFPGSIKVRDVNGDYKIDANSDRVFRGSATPSWTGGITNTFNYKGVELSTFIYARWNFILRTGAENLQGRFAQRVVNYWTPTNPTNDYPAPNNGNASGDPFVSSMNYQDGSFIKIRNITLGYFLPAKVTKSLGLSRVKVYAQALNPGLLYSKIDWIDPDLGGSTFNRGFVMGLNVGF
ncbi:SusC/RagA family TonB-linked outer membrane protein [Mucilaginibacter terrae]|nr:TonB-dependent receptor [Mucilaginibacter terrae]